MDVAVLPTPFSATCSDPRELKRQDMSRRVTDPMLRSTLFEAEFRRLVLAKKRGALDVRNIPTPTEVSLGASLPDEIEDYLTGALAIGYNRALLHCFIAEQGIPDQWLCKERAAPESPARHRGDRRFDYELVLASYPDLDTFYVEVDDSEVLLHATYALYDLLCSPGTDFHQNNLSWNYKYHEGKKQSDLHYELALATVGSSHEKCFLPKIVDYSHRYYESPEDAGELSEWSNPSWAVLPDAQGQDEDPFLHENIINLACILTQRFGPRAALYWLWRTLRAKEFHNHYYLIRLFTGMRKGDPGFSALRRDLDRKMDKVDDYVHSLSQSPEELARLDIEAQGYKGLSDADRSEDVEKPCSTRSETFGRELERRKESRGTVADWIPRPPRRKTVEGRRSRIEEMLHKKGN